MKIIATEEQLSLAKNNKLQVIAIPLEAYANVSHLNLFEYGRAAKDGDGNWIFWFPGDVPDLEDFTLKSYPKGSGKGTEIPFKEGDRIFLAQKWYVRSEEIAEGQKIVFDLPEFLWQPAETMPLKAAQYWFAIENVRVLQIRDISDSDIREILGLDQTCPRQKAFAKFEHSWNKESPGYLCNSCRWAIVLEVELCSPKS